MKIITAILVAALALLSFGCGGDDAATGYGPKGAGATTVPGTEEPTAATGPSGKKGAQAPVESDRGSAGIPTVSDPDDPRFAEVSGGEGRNGQPEIVPSDRPQPKQLLVRDIEVGSGPVAHPGDRVAVFYLGVDYKTGERRFQTWPPTAQPFEVELRTPDSAEGWELGIMGMRAGGRREVLVPSHLAFDNGALDYVFDLVRVEPAKAAGAG